MKLRPIVLLFSIFCFSGPGIALAQPPFQNNCVIDVAHWEALVLDETQAEWMISNGNKPAGPGGIRVAGDAGWIGGSYIVFELPAFDDPVMAAKLRLQVKSAGWPDGHAFDEVDLPSLDIELHRITNLPVLLQPLWTVNEYNYAKWDISSGRFYGDFSVRRSPEDDYKILEVPLSNGVLFDIDAAAGGLFGIGIYGGERFVDEGGGIYFLTPDEGGVVQLVLTKIRKGC